MYNYNFNFFLCISLLDEDVVLLLVIVQAKAMAGAKSYQLPLWVQGEGSDHSRRLALDQSKGLEAWRKQHWLLSHVQLSVTLINNKTNKTLKLCGAGIVLLSGGKSYSKVTSSKRAC